MKKKDVLFVILVSIFFLALTRLPVKYAFAGSYARELTIVVIVGIITALAIITIRKLKLQAISGLVNHNYSNYWMLLLPFVFPGILFFINLRADCFGMDLSFFISLALTLVLGLWEELVFRGIIFSYLLKKHKKSFHIPILISSLVFGIGHSINVSMSSPVSVLNQVIYAIFMGLLFAALLVRTRNIWLCGLMHGLLNFFVGACSQQLISGELNEKNSLQEAIPQAMGMILLLSPILVIYFVLMRTLKPKEIQYWNSLLGNKPV